MVDVFERLQELGLIEPLPLSSTATAGSFLLLLFLLQLLLVPLGPVSELVRVLALVSLGGVFSEVRHSVPLGLFLHRKELLLLLDEARHIPLSLDVFDLLV